MLPQPLRLRETPSPHDPDVTQEALKWIDAIGAFHRLSVERGLEHAPGLLLDPHSRVNMMENVGEVAFVRGQQTPNEREATDRAVIQTLFSMGADEKDPHILAARRVPHLCLYGLGYVKFLYFAAAEAIRERRIVDTLGEFVRIIARQEIASAKSATTQGLSVNVEGYTLKELRTLLAGADPDTFGDVKVKALESRIRRAKCPETHAPWMVQLRATKLPNRRFSATAVLNAVSVVKDGAALRRRTQELEYEAERDAKSAALRRSTGA